MTISARRTVLALLCAALFITDRAQSSTIGEVQQHIALLQSMTGSASYAGRDAGKHRLALLERLSDAVARLSIGKTAEALERIAEFKSKVQELQREGRLDPTAGTAMAIEADVTIALIRGLTSVPAGQRRTGDDNPRHRREDRQTS